MLHELPMSELPTDERPTAENLKTKNRKIKNRKTKNWKTNGRTNNGRKTYKPKTEKSKTEKPKPEKPKTEVPISNRLAEKVQDSMHYQIRVHFVYSNHLLGCQPERYDVWSSTSRKRGNSFILVHCSQERRYTPKLFCPGNFILESTNSNRI